MIKDLKLIQQKLNIQTVEDSFYSSGISDVMIKRTMVKYKTLLNQQKQTVQPVIREQRAYLQLVIVLCI